MRPGFRAELGVGDLGKCCPVAGQVHDEASEMLATLNVELRFGFDFRGMFWILARFCWLSNSRQA
mgnify:CR=1 FL=1